MLLKPNIIKTNSLKILASLFCLISCVEKPEPIKDCELYSTSNVTIFNESGVTLIVDVTWNGVNEEILLLDEESTVYENIPAGDIKFWCRLPDIDYWVYETYWLYECKELSFTWGPCVVERFKL